MSSTGAEPQATLLRILIVDDNVAAAQTTGWMVEMMDCEFRLAHTPAEALIAVAEYRPDIAMLDIGLPGTDGFELCRQMKVLPETANTIFIAQTGWAGDSYRLRAEECGFGHYLVKPVPYDTLEKIIADIHTSLSSI